MGNDSAPTIDPGFELNDGRVARIACSKLLDVVHDHLHWAARTHSQEIGHGDVHGRPLAPVIPANGHWMQADALLGESQRDRQLLLHLVRHLAGGPDLDSSLVIDPYDAGVGFQVRLMLSGYSKGMLDDEVGLGKALLEVTLAPRIADKGIGGDFQRSGESDITVHLRMQDRSILPQSLQR